MNRRTANQALKLYYDGDREAEMNYEVWQYVYLDMQRDIETLGARAATAAQAQNVTPGKLLYMWPDAVASYLFDQVASPRAGAR
jgi:tRNA(Glu) U13 pseudouridine synthase TruD